MHAEPCWGLSSGRPNHKDILSWAGGNAHESALDRRGYATNRGKFVEWCGLTLSKPTLSRRTAI